MDNDRHIIDLKKPHSAPLPLPVQNLEATPLGFTIVGMVKKRLIIVGFLVGLAVTIYLFSHKPSAPTAPLLQPAASQTSAGPVSGDIVAKVGKLMLLPQGEVPTIALVKDLAPLKGQVFFANAKLGDVVLMYGKAQRAILYRPSADKIIEVGPITTH